MKLLAQNMFYIAHQF